MNQSDSSTAVLETPLWREENDVMYVTVVSDGTTGAEWIQRLKQQGVQLRMQTEKMLLSAEFVPTTGVITEIAILKGNVLSDRDRSTDRIYVEGICRKLAKPHAEAACLLRVLLSDDDLRAMDIHWLVIMSQPIHLEGNTPMLLFFHPRGDNPMLEAHRALPNTSWGHLNGYAFDTQRFAKE